MHGLRAVIPEKRTSRALLKKSCRRRPAVVTNLGVESVGLQLSAYRRSEGHTVGRYRLVESGKDLQRFELLMESFGKCSKFQVLLQSMCYESPLTLSSNLSIQLIS